VLRLTRRAVAGAVHPGFADAVRHAEDVYLNQLMATEDAKEGLRAIAEKRRPSWQNR
jgi:cyclohexa-1,5-dienecarbonyl-CoA hydratase